MRELPALATASAMPKSATSADPSWRRNILGFNVPVDHAVAMRIVERRRDFGRETDCVGDRELLLAREPVAQALSLDERHHIVGRAVHLAAIDQPENVGMLQCCDGLDLTEKSLGPNDRGELGAQHLDRNLAIVLEVLSQVDGGHPALADLPLECDSGRRGLPGAGTPAP